MPANSANRRDSHIKQVGDELADAVIDSADRVPSAGDTLRMASRAMACEFSVIMNPGPARQVMDASEALEVVHELEQQLSVYRPDSEVSHLNQSAWREARRVESRLFELLLLARRLHHDTGGGFDITAGPLIRLWKNCRDANRIPSQAELTECLKSVGMSRVRLDPECQTVAFESPDTRIDLGAIGKGYALDCMAQKLVGQGFDEWLLHGGHSSILARGDHNGTGGWPVGIGNPLFTQRRLGTVLLRDQAMGTSGSNIQFFRHGGRRYGHILDPRTGWPVEGALSVTVLAPTAALADALSTAFYVTGLDGAAEYCRTHPAVGAIVIPFPKNDRRLCPITIGLDESQIFWDKQQIRQPVV
jgi:thiamine biosynthesis lipoprotein